MRVRVKFKYPHEVNQVVRPNFKVAGRKYIEELGSTVKGGGDYCFTHKDPQTVIVKKEARKKRRSNYRYRKSLSGIGIATAAGRGYG
jgi:hypothetical protein